MKECEIKNLYNLDETIAKDIFEGCTYPWEVLPKIKDYIIKLGNTLSEEEYDKIGENIWIAKSATVAKTAYINGPCIIGKNAEVRHCAFIRGNAIVGENSVVGNSTELKNCILFNDVKVPHFNYVGDSIMGHKSHMGAGAIVSNLKSDEREASRKEKYYIKGTNSKGKHKEIEMSYDEWNDVIVGDTVKIADFGLGKDLRVFSSHQTFHTNAVGQYFYCAPEQFMLLKDGDKRSDVYSLGRVINFIMTKDPQNSHHLFRSVAEKSTNSNSVYRYNDASQLYSFFEKAVTYSAQAKSQERIANKIQCKEYDDEVENYIYMMNSEQISKAILANQPGFTEALFSFMKSSEDQAQHIIQSVEQSYQDVCYGSFEANDPFADFAAAVIKSDFPFVVKEIAASILHYIAWNVNRFHAQRLIENLISNGIEPLLEESLHG